MNLKFLSAAIIAASFSFNALAQTNLTENNKGVSNAHTFYLTPHYTQDKSGNKTQQSPNYFIRCTNSMVGGYNQMFEVTQEGAVSATSLRLVKGGSNHPYNPTFSTKWNNNGELELSTLSYMGSYKNAIVNFGKLTINNEVIVNGKLSCKDELNVTEVNTKNIRTQDITVDMNNAADYVFEDNYDLKSLSEVESYVKKNKHLPGVPSASEMAQNGMSVAEMSNLLLEKVEELTLHMIELQKENQALKAKMELLEK
ncbi:MAG: hypothetical protein MJZ14_01320 [Paludibacteraceae bacterium]|nr:hypothetical protein [Paludibacteraceae bacterium]